MDAILIYGQSNAGIGGETPATFTCATDANEAVGFLKGSGVWGATPFEPELISGIAKLTNPPSSPLALMVPAAVALEQFVRDGGAASPRWFWHTVSNGGQPIQEFLRGTQTYDNLLIAANRFAVAARASGTIPIVRAVAWVQGESRSPDYAASLSSLIATLVPDIMTQTGQGVAPKFLILQINNAIQETWFHTSALDQLAVARDSDECILIGPMYYTPLGLFTVSPPDGLHGTEIGRMMTGEMLALCCKALFHDYIDWVPLVPLALKRDDNEITIQFSKPTYGRGLAWDTMWVGSNVNYGFFYGDEQSSAELASVTLDSANYQVVLTLTGPSTGMNPFVSYAMGPGGQAILAPWPGNRGQLISPTAQHSTFHRLGYAVPRTVNHYAARFQLLIT
jgi:hypothetical protein